jgi:CO/xanthine dehydrogenase FAD-binding subunit
VVEEIKPITDMRSTAEYRKDVAKVIARRGIRTALERIRKLGG